MTVRVYIITFTTIEERSGTRLMYLSLHAFTHFSTHMYSSTASQLHAAWMYGAWHTHAWRYSDVNGRVCGAYSTCSSSDINTDTNGELEKDLRCSSYSTVWLCTISTDIITYMNGRKVRSVVL